MEKKTGYKSKRRDEILKYFQSHTDQHVTAGDVYGYFRSNGYTIGMTTVYRQLDKLVGDGVLNKYTIEAGSPSCYEYSEHAPDSGAVSCFHCKCEVCGKLIHLQCHEIAGLKAHLAEHHDFVLNPMRTVFYGICASCREEGQE